LATNLVATYNIPVCIINGAVGGTRIDQHQANPANHYAADSYGNTIYADLLTRVAGAKLTHGIRNVLWHQGENNSGAAAPTGDWDYKSYQQYFVDMSAAWRQDYPNIQHYYIFQVCPKPCSMGPKGDQLREVQRTLPRLYSNMSVMSTLGLPGYLGCHFSAAGYTQIASLVTPLVKRDNYGLMPSLEITAPDVKRAYYTSTNRNEIALEFGQQMAWNPAATVNFYLDHVAGKVASGSVSGNTVKLQLTAPSTAQTIDYVEDAFWDGSSANLLDGINSIAALTFYDVPLESLPVSSLVNMPASGCTLASAALNAKLSCIGTNYAVHAYWNTVNGGKNASLWTNSASVGTYTNVTMTNLAWTVTGLASNTTYYFTFRGTNAADTLWATNVLSFTTLSNLVSQTITFNALAGKTYGNAPFALSATASSGLTVSYASSDPTVASVSSNIVTVLKAGSTIITASQAGDGFYYSPAAPVGQTLVVSKASQTITFGALSAKTCGDAPFALAATASSGLAVSYTSSDPAVASVSGNLVTVLKAGITVITASQPGDGNYNAAADVPQPLTVNRAGQTITFGALAAKTYGDAPFALTATASSGLAVSYASSDPTVAGVSGSTVTILKAGSTVITASQTGNDSYNAATNVSQALTANKLPVLLAGTRGYDGTTAVAATNLSVANNVDGTNLSLTGNAILAGKDVGPQALVSGYVALAGVQRATGNTGAGAAAAITVTLGAAPANGNTLVAVISTRGTSSGRVSSITQAGAAWTRAAEAANANGTTAEIWYAPNVSGAATAITINQASLRSAAVVTEYSGVLAASALDQTASATGSGIAAVTGTTPATTQANELWVGGIGLSGSACTLGAALNGFAAVTNAQTGSGTAADNAKVYVLESITNAAGAAASGGAVSGTQTAVIAQRGTATSANNSGNSVTIAKPTGVVSGDVMIACMAQRNSSGTPSDAVLSGWNVVKSGTLGTSGTSRYGTILSKVAGNSEPGSYTFALAAAVGGAVGDIVAFSGVDNVTPVDAVGLSFTTAGGSSGSATVSADTINTVSANVAAIMFGMAAGITSTGTGGTWSNWTSGLIELYDAHGTGTGTSATSVGAAWKTVATPGATGGGVATLSTPMRNGGLWVALRPASLPAQWAGAIATFKAAPALSMAGAAADNYTLNGATGTVQIVAKALTVSGLAASSKTYDGTNSAALSGTAALLAAEAAGTGTATDGTPYTGDAVTLGGAATAAFADKHVGNAKLVTVTGLTLGGAQAGNYIATQPVGLTADITSRPVAVTAVMAAKAYDGTTAAAGTPGITPALVDGDTATVLAQAFQTPDVGVSNKVIEPVITISDGNGGTNYAVTLQNFTAGTINPSPPVIPPGDGSGNGFSVDPVTGVTLQFEALGGAHYRLRYTDDLLLPTAEWLWVNPPVDGWNTALTNGPMILTDPGATDSPQRFYLIEAR
ncbi:MAG: YDG domain-containing protein, partial [bacterium]